jgi:hypothetical protein
MDQSDEEIMAALQSGAPTVGAPRTIADNFVSAALLVAQAKKDTHLSETTLVKLLELQMMWALNTPSRSPYPLTPEEPTPTDAEEEPA